MKTNNTPHSRSVVVQTTLRVCELDDDVLVLSEHGCQTITTTVPTTDNQSVVPFLEFTPFSEIVKDSQRVIDLPRKALLQFDFNNRAPLKSASEISPKSALKKSLSSSDKLNDENLTLSLVPIPKMPQKTQDEQEIQTNLTVSPYILAEDDVATVCAQLSVQTSITFDPTDSLSEITSALKAAMKHTKNFQSVIVDGKIVTDYVDPTADEKPKKKNSVGDDDKSEETSSVDEGQESEETSDDLTKKKSTEKPSVAKIDDKQSSKIEERQSKTVQPVPLPFYMSEEEFEKNVQKILDKTVKNVYEFMAKIVEMYDQSKNKEEKDNVELSPETEESENKTLTAKGLFPLEEENEEQLLKEKEDENSPESPITKLQSNTVDKPPPTSGGSSRKFLKPDDALGPDTPIEASIERKRSSALRMVTGLVRGPKWVIQKALGVDIDTGLPTPTEKETLPDNDITVGTEINLDNTKAGVEFVAVDSKEAIERFTPKKKLEKQETIEEIPEDQTKEPELVEEKSGEISTTGVVTSTSKKKLFPKSETKDGTDSTSKDSIEQDKNKEISTTMLKSSTGEDGTKPRLDDNQPKIEFVPVNNEEATEYFTTKKRLQRTDAVDETPESTTEEPKALVDVKSEEFPKTEEKTSITIPESRNDPIDNILENSRPIEQDKSKSVVTPNEETPTDKDEIDVKLDSQETINNNVKKQDIVTNEEISEAPLPSEDINNDDIIVPPSTTEDIGDSSGKSSSNEIPCECGSIHEGGAAPPALSTPRSQPETSIKFELTLLNDGRVTQNAVEGLVVKASISRIDTRKEQHDGGADVINVSVIVGSQTITATSTGQMAIGGPDEDSEKQEDNFQEEENPAVCSCTDFESAKSSEVVLKPSAESKSQITCSCENESKLEESLKTSEVEIKPSKESKSQIICSCEHESKPTESAKPSKVQIKPSMESKETDTSDLATKSQIICSCAQEYKPTVSAKPSKVEDKPLTKSNSKIICSCDHKSKPTEPNKISPSNGSKSQIICRCGNESKPPCSAKPSKVEIKPPMESKETDTDNLKTEHKGICSCKHESKPLTSIKQSEADAVPFTTSIKQSKVMLKASTESKGKSKDELLLVLTSQELVTTNIPGISKSTGPSDVVLKPRLESAKQSKVEFAKETIIKEESHQAIKCSCRKEKGTPATSSNENKDEITPQMKSGKQSEMTSKPSRDRSEKQEPSDSDSEEESHQTIKCSCRKEKGTPATSSNKNKDEITPQMTSGKQSEMTSKPSRDRSEEQEPSDSDSEDFIECSCEDGMSEKQKQIEIQPTLRTMIAPSTELTDRIEPEKLEELVICSCSNAPKQSLASEKQIPDKISIKVDSEMLNKAKKKKCKMCAKKPQALSSMKQMSVDLQKASTIVVMPPKGISVCKCLEECKVKSFTGEVKQCGSDGIIIRSGEGSDDSESQALLPCTCKMSTTGKQEICTCTEQCELKMLGTFKVCGKKEFVESKSATESESQKALLRNIQQFKVQNEQEEICTCTEECELMTLSGPVKECGTQSDVLKRKLAIESESQEILSSNLQKSKVQDTQEEICTCIEECELITLTGPVKECGTQSDVLERKSAIESESQKILPSNLKKSDVDGKQEICTCIEECKLITLSGPVKECGTQTVVLKSKSVTESESREILPCNYMKSIVRAKHEEICTFIEEYMKTLSGPVKECGTQSEILKSKLAVESLKILPCDVCKKPMTRPKQDICTCIAEYELKLLSEQEKERAMQSQMVENKYSQEFLPCGCRKPKLPSEENVCSCAEKPIIKPKVCECKSKQPPMQSVSYIQSEIPKPSAIKVCDCQRPKKQTTSIQDAHVSRSGRVKDCATQSEILKSKSAVESLKILPCDVCKKPMTRAKQDICTCTAEYELKLLSEQEKERAMQSQMVENKYSQEYLPCGCRKPKLPSEENVCSCAEKPIIKPNVCECKSKQPPMQSVSYIQSEIPKPAAIKVCDSRGSKKQKPSMLDAHVSYTERVIDCGTQSEILKSKSAVESLELLPCGVCKKAMTPTNQDICACIAEYELKLLSEQEIERGTPSQLVGNKDSQGFLPCGCRKPYCSCVEKPIYKPNVCECKSKQPPTQTVSDIQSEMPKPTPIKVCDCQEPKDQKSSIQNPHISQSKSLPSNVKQSRSEICVCQIQSKPLSQSILKSQRSSLTKAKSMSQKELTCICKRPDGAEQLEGDTCPCKTKERMSSILNIKSDRTKPSKTNEDLILGPLNVCMCANEKPEDAKLKKSECPCSLQQNKKYKQSIENYMKKLLQDSMNAKDPELIQQHAACLEPYLQQLAGNLDETEGIGGKEVRCTGDASQQCVCSVEVLYVHGQSLPPSKVDKSCACSIPKAKKPTQRNASYRESSSKYCNCDMENEPTPNLECMYEGDEDYSEMYMQELGDNGLGFKLEHKESESECTCRKNELPEVVVDSDKCGATIEMPWLSIALPPPGTYEIISNKPPKKICECWNLDLKDSILSATELETDKSAVCECKNDKPQGSIILQPEEGSVHQPESRTTQPEIILSPSSGKESTYMDPTNDSSSGDESGCSCSTELEDCENLPIESTKFVYDNPCFAQNEPYMDPLYKYFPDDCDTYCGPFTEIHWSDILLPKRVNLRQAVRKSKSTSVCQDVVPAVLPNYDPIASSKIEPHENENSISARASEVEIEICFTQIASTLLKVEGGADSQRTVSEISTISDVRMKVKRCPKDYVVTVFADGQYQRIEGEGFLKTVGSQPFTITQANCAQETISNFLVAIQPASHVPLTQQPNISTPRESQLEEAGLLAMTVATTEAVVPKKFSSLPNMSVATLTSAQFRENFPRALVDYLKDEPEDIAKELGTTEEQLEPGICYPCRNKDKEASPEGSKINNEDRNDITEEPRESKKTNTIDDDSLSVNTIRSEEFREKYNIPPPTYEDPQAMGLYTYAMPEMEQRIMDISQMMVQNLALTANESSSAIEEANVDQTVGKEPKLEAEIGKPLGSIKPPCHCSKAVHKVIMEPKIGKQVEKPLGSTKPKCHCSKVKIGEKVKQPVRSSKDDQSIVKEPTVEEKIEKPPCVCPKSSTRSIINIQEITQKEMQCINTTIEEIKSKLRCMDIPELDNWKKFDEPRVPPPCRRTDTYPTTQQMPQMPEMPQMRQMSEMPQMRQMPQMSQMPQIPQFPPSYQFSQPPQAPIMYPSSYYPDRYTYSGTMDYSMFVNTNYPSHSAYMDSDITEEDYICSCVKRKAAKKRRRKRKVIVSSSEYSCTSTGSSGSKVSASLKSIPSCRKSCIKPKPISSESDNRCSQVSFSCESNRQSQARMEIMEYSYYDHTPTDTDPEVEIRVGKGPPKIKTKNTFKGMITKEPNKCKFKVEVKLSPSKLKNLQKRKSVSDTECSSCGRIN